MKRPTLCDAGVLRPGPFTLTNLRRTQYVTVGDSVGVNATGDKIFQVQWQAGIDFFKPEIQWIETDRLRIEEKRGQGHFELTVDNGTVFALYFLPGQNNAYASHLLCDGKIKVETESGPFFVEENFSATTVETEGYRFSAWPVAKEGQIIQCLDSPGSAFCQDLVTSLCSEEYNTSLCQEFCKLGGDYNCDQAAEIYCQEGDHHKEENCGCFLSETFYGNFFSDLLAKFGYIYPPKPECSYPPCVFGKRRNDNKFNYDCPDVNICYQNLVVNNEGHIGNLTPIQTINCTSGEPMAPEYKYQCQAGTCVEVQEGLGTYKTADCDNKCQGYACVQGKCVPSSEGRFDSTCDYSCEVKWWDKIPIWGYILGGVLLLSIFAGVFRGKTKTGKR